LFLIKSAIIIKVIWVTLLYAIIFLTSSCIKVRTPESRVKDIQNLGNQLVILIKEEIRAAPYLPNFNKSPARIIEPEVLASTWAFGSQKWSPNTGIFTRKGDKNKSIENLLLTNNLEDQLKGRKTFVVKNKITK